MEVKSGLITLKYVPYSKASGIAVVVSWDCPHGNQTALNCLKHEMACDSKGVAETAVSYVMSQGIENVLVGDPASTDKFLVSDICYNALNKMFSVSYVTKGSATVLGRGLKAILKALQPKKYMSAVSALMRSVGQSLNPESSKYLEAHAVSSLKKGITVFVAGKMKVEKEKLQLIIDAVAGSFPDLKEPDGKKSAPEIKKSIICPIANTKTSSFNVSGINMVYLYYYLHNKLKQDADVEDGKLIISKQSDGKIASLKKKETVAAYVAAKYGKLKDNLPAGVAYFASRSGMFDAESLHKLGNPTLSSVEKGISDSL